MSAEALVQARHARAALARARLAVDPACDLVMTTTPGVLALVLPEDRRRRPEPGAGTPPGCHRR